MACRRVSVSMDPPRRGNAKIIPWDCSTRPDRTSQNVTDDIIIDYLHPKTSKTDSHARPDLRHFHYKHN